MSNTLASDATPVRRQRYLDQMMPWLDAPVVKVLTGVRRCGKSVLLQQMRQELIAQGVHPDRIVLINFESLANEPLTDHQALYQHLIEWAERGQGRPHIFLDEVQLVDRWERVVNSLRVDLDCDLVVTGSNAWLLSNDLAKLLTGRYVAFDVYPFSFAEYCDAFRAPRPANRLTDVFRSYLELGGMPGVHEVEGTDAAMTYLRDVSNSILLKDVVARKKLRDVGLLERLLAFVMDNLGRPFSARRVSAFLKSQRRSLGSETVYHYLHALTDAHLVHRASRYDVKGRRLLETQEKYFLADHGFVHSWLGHRPDEVPGILENIVYLELRRRGYEVHIGKHDDLEIDFVADRAGRRLYVQVCYRLTPTALDREFEPLDAIADNHRKIVLSLDEEPSSNRNGVERHYLPEFLLDESW